MRSLPKSFTRSARWLRAIVALAFAAGMASLALAPSAAAEPVKVQRSIPYASTAQVPPAVKEQCQLETKVPEFLSQAAGGNVQLVDGALNRKVGRVLEMEISEVHAPGGGAFSGPKWMTVNGALYDRGKQIGSFRAKRYTTGGAFGAFKGTCSIIGRCTKTIGEDIARWLAAPTQNAVIGDAN
jgi:hypothetical protein